VDLSAFASLKDSDLRARGLVVGEGRLLATRLIEACRREAGASSRAGLPLPRFEALGIACVPALLEEFLALADGLCPVEALREGELAAMVGFPFHRGVIAAARRVGSPPGATEALLGSGAAAASRLVALPATVDPENLGSILRSAAALGWDGILLGAASCDHLSRRVARVSMGATFSLPVLALEGPADLEALDTDGWGLAAAVLDPVARDLRTWSPPPRLVLLFGNEHDGLGPEWLGPGVERLTIPMAPGADSLNAAAAAAVFLHRAAGAR
jgi:tRNA G18 (ribose-2'-O)-methylase SpoU